MKEKNHAERTVWKGKAIYCDRGRTELRKALAVRNLEVTQRRRDELRKKGEREEETLTPLGEKNSIQRRTC